MSRALAFEQELAARREEESWEETIGDSLASEAYANFGVSGIGLVMVLQGVIFALLDTMLNGPRSDGGRAIYLVIMAYFLNGIGSSAAVLFGALVQQILASALILRPFAYGFRSDQRQPEHETQPVSESAAAFQ